ncbi:MAG TPA: hypothetical protein VN786_02575 [Acidimicrobiales bacterium]|nr:hypothetical protein [Acidimicrobiales bacterium]
MWGSLLRRTPLPSIGISGLLKEFDVGQRENGKICTPAIGFSRQGPLLLVWGDPPSVPL